MAVGVSFFRIGNFVSYTKKPSRQDRAAAEKKYAARATRRRRRISQNEILLLKFPNSVF